MQQFRLGAARTLSIPARAIFTWVVWELGMNDTTGIGDHLIDAEPTVSQWYSDAAWGTWSALDTAGALGFATKATEVDSTFYEGWDILSLIQADRGDFAAADRAHRQAIKFSGGDYWVRIFNEGLIAGRRRDMAAVRQALKQLDGDPRLAQQAGLLHILGETDAMYTMLNKAFDAKDPDILQACSPRRRCTIFAASLGTPRSSDD
jgi:hypothetical protein